MTIRRRPRLNLIRAWQLFDRMDIDAAIHAVDEAERVVQQDQAGSAPREAQNLQGASAAMRAFLHTFTREPDLDQVQAWAEAALADLELDRYNFRELAAAALAFVYVFRGGLAAAERASSEAADPARAAANIYLATFATTSRILMARAQGRYREATALCRETLGWMANHNAQNSPSMSALNTALAGLLREVNELDEARHRADLSLQQADNGANPAQALFCRYTQARVKQAQGGWEGAVDSLNQVAARLPQGSLLLHPSLPAATVAQWQMMRGQLALALRWVQETDWEESSLASIRTSSDLIWRCAHLWIARAQIFITQGRGSGDHRLLQEARAYLVRRQAFAEATGLAWLQIKMLALRALANEALGEAASATACLEQALTLAEPEGYVRSFVDEGEPMPCGAWQVGTGE
jgi:ATP/maltotriose-dependent transcriptional regulator MalT